MPKRAITCVGKEPLQDYRIRTSVRIFYHGIEQIAITMKER